jgi:arogenate dehydrogenase (NADP+)
MNVGIVGLGLIGGSMGLDLRSRGLRVLGVSRQEKTCQLALERGAVDEASVSLDLLAAADLVVICTPLGAIAPTLTRLLPYLSPQTTVTDVGSVKAAIVQECSQIWSDFVGGHPMAGTAEQGIEAAQTHLFDQAAYVLTPTETTPPSALEAVAEMARSLGSRVYYCSPETHDLAVAWISHLPVMVSGALIQSCLGESDPQVLALAQQLASSGFRDTSRVGGGNPELGVMMARYNRSALLRSLSQYRQELTQLIDAIEQENWQYLEQVLKTTQQARPQFQGSR